MGRRWIGFAMIGALLGGCTLDFEEFRESTVDPDPITPDMGDMGDVFVPPDMAPPDMLPPDMDLDGDMDGVLDDVDNCPMISNADQADFDEDGIGDVCDDDADGDDVLDDADNCLMLPNPDQFDLDRDMQGDACDDDADGDGLPLAEEEAAGTDPRRADTDGDAALDGEDSCPLRADRVALDVDMDGYGDACDQDDDGDGIRDWADNCPGTPNPEQGDDCAGDRDGDMVPDEGDNCPYIANPDQAIVPCDAAFSTLTYSRSTTALSPFEEGVIAGTAGGLLLADGYGDIERLTNADGLSGNRIRDIAVDEAGRQWATTDRGLTVIRPDGFVFSMYADDSDGGPMGDLRDVAVGAGAIWVSSDAGLNRLGDDGWSMFDGALPGGDAIGLYVDPLDRLWVTSTGGVVRIVDGAIDATYDMLPAIGPFVDVADNGERGVWILGENGAVELDGLGMVVPGGPYEGFSVRDIAVRGQDAYLATGTGLRRIDRDGRLLPTGIAVDGWIPPLPSSDLRAIVPSVFEDFWVGTAAGLLRIDSYFATYDRQAVGGDCVTISLRAGGYLWVGTRQGALIVDADGSFRALENLPGILVSDLAVVGEEVWIGTENGVGVYGLDGTPGVHITNDGELLPAAPVTDIEVVTGRDEVWVGTDGGGVARRNPNGDWQTFTTQNAGNNFLSDDITAMAYGNSEMWLATPLGLTVYNTEEGAFELAVTTQGGRLPVARVDDVAVGGGRVFAATAAGVAVRSEAGLWTTLRRQVGGIPNEAGTDAARSVAYDGENLWIALDVSRRLEYGSLLRRSPDPAVRDGFLLLPPDAAGLPQTPALGGVDLEWFDGELTASYCGDGDDPGGFGILGGRGLIEADVAHDALRGEGDLAVLTGGPNGNPMVAGQTPEGPVADLIDVEGVQPVTLPELDVPPTACGTPVVEGDNLWCVFNGVGFGRRFGNDQWNLGRRESIPALGNGDLRDIVVESDTIAWLASAEGVVHVNGGSVRALNNAFTGGGLPADEVRSVTLSEGRLFAGTAGGVGVYDIGNNTWTAIGPQALPNASVQAVAVAPDGTLWIGTDDGLFHRGIDGAMIADFDTSTGLPVNQIRDVMVHPDGRIIVATPGGVAVGDGSGSFTTYGFIDGLPGASAYELALDRAGRVWARSNDGIGRLDVGP